MTHLGEPSARITTELIRMLNHPVRREALRIIHQAPDGQVGGNQLSRAITESVQSVNNHLRVLRGAHAIVICDEVRVRNAKEKWYESLVAGIPTVLSVLNETETEDAMIRRS